MFRKKTPTPTTVDWLIVGLGNPGPEYRGTRHNVGFEVVEAFAIKHKVKLNIAKHRAQYGIGAVSGVAIALVKPLTYMNLSGQAVAPIAKQYSVPPDRVLVISDDLDMATGRVRLKPKGSAGGHNGHKSLVGSLGTQDYPRLKIGIGRSGDATIDHVLSTFKPAERELINAAVDRSVYALEELLRDDLAAAMNVANVGE